MGSAMPRFDKSPLCFKSSGLLEDASDKSDVLDSNQVRVVNKDGRTLFTVVLGEDGRSIEVRRTNGTLIDGKYYDNLSIQPLASNVVELRLFVYAD
jgi:hypothetical protein